jgi:hypothetical protein
VEAVHEQPHIAYAARMPGFVRLSRSRLKALLLALAGVSALAGCAKSLGDMRSDESGDSGTEDGRRDASAAAPGFVQCGEQLCDVAGGNQCYACTKTEFHCQTRDLPRLCEPAASFDCDGPEDCAGAPCVEHCAQPGVCSLPGRVCTLL